MLVSLTAFIRYATLSIVLSPLCAKKISQRGFRYRFQMIQLKLKELSFL